MMGVMTCPARLAGEQAFPQEKVIAMT